MVDSDAPVYRGSRSSGSRLEFSSFLLRDQAARVSLDARVSTDDSSSTGLERFKIGASRAGTSP